MFSRNEHNFSWIDHIQSYIFLYFVSDTYRNGREKYQKEILNVSSFTIFRMHTERLKLHEDTEEGLLQIFL